MIGIIDSEWGLIFVVLAVLLLFGSAQLPKLARSIGQAQKEFRQGQSDASVSDEEPASIAATPARAADARMNGSPSGESAGSTRP
jgi:sec-independent protein translocase protein TatA